MPAFFGEEAGIFLGIAEAAFDGGFFLFVPRTDGVVTAKGDHCLLAVTPCAEKAELAVESHADKWGFYRGHFRFEGGDDLICGD